MRRPKKQTTHSKRNSLKAEVGGRVRWRREGSMGAHGDDVDSFETERTGATRRMSVFCSSSWNLELVGSFMVTFVARADNN